MNQPLVTILAAFGAVVLAVVGASCGDDEQSPAPTEFGDCTGVVFAGVVGAGNDYRVHCVRPDGTGLHNLTGAPAFNLVQPAEGSPLAGSYEAFPAWSPDGKQVAFVHSDGPGQQRIHVAEASTGSERTLASATLARDLRWSPDGKQIAFVAQQASSFELMVVDLEGGAPRVVSVSAGDETYPAWSPDGTRIAVYVITHAQEAAGDTATVDVVGLDGSRKTLVPSSIGPGWATWAPDGRALYFGAAGPQGVSPGLHRVEVETGAIVRLTDVPTCGDEPRVSPGGQRVAFTQFSDGQCDVYTANLDGSQRSRVTATPGLTELNAGWSAAGDRLLLVVSNASDQPGDEQIITISPSGEDQQTVVNAFRAIAQTWSLPVSR